MVMGVGAHTDRSVQVWKRLYVRSGDRTALFINREIVLGTHFPSRCLGFPICSEGIRTLAFVERFEICPQPVLEKGWGH